MATKGKQSGFVDNWQNGKTLPECNLHMLETEDFCDVSFRVGSDGHVIRAHRYVLVSRSCVFHAMFCGQMAEQGEITIPDIEADVFKEFLKFLYTDNVALTVENSPGLLYTSRKYDVDALFAQCASYLEKSLIEENVCELIERCHGYGEVDIEEKALKVLENSGERTLKSSGFNKLCPPCFEKFLTSDDLRMKEKDVFEATLTWAKERCKEEDLEPSPENQRKILGNLIHQIRFPALSHAYLTKTVRKSQILTAEERMTLVDKITNPDVDVTPFVSRQRKNRIDAKYYVKRFRDDFAASDGYTCTNTLDSISFSTDRDIHLIGCQIYGPVAKSEGSYDVTVRIYNDQGMKLSEPYRSSHIRLKGNRGISDVMFPHPVAIRARQKYALGIKLTGRKCNFGSAGVDTLEVEGVTFNFMNSIKFNNDWRTSLYSGQIPCLIWRHC